MYIGSSLNSISTEALTVALSIMTTTGPDVALVAEMFPVNAPDVQMMLESLILCDKRYIYTSKLW